MENVKLSVSKIIEDVIENKDYALKKYNIQFDSNFRADYRVTEKEIKEAYNKISPELLEDIKKAAKNIENFARAQKETQKELNDFEVAKGVYLGHKIVPVNSCCCYVPGGNYPLYSSALMLIIPARVAGVKRIVACSPTIKGSPNIHPFTLVAMDIAGADEMYATGGAHTIAAFAYGTESLAPVDLIVGPGNKYVAEAKRQCYGKVGIDFVAGPSEVLIIADESGKANYIAADILAQCEHDINSKAVLITTSDKLAKEVELEVKIQLKTLSTSKTASEAWNQNGEIIVTKNIDKAIEMANRKAPEHLEVHLNKENLSEIEKLTNYGALFIGENSAEVFGDYASGSNHTLPTSQASRYTGGVYVGTFTKTLTYQRIEKEGIDSIANTCRNMAENEGLFAHAEAAKLRLNSKNI